MTSSNSRSPRSPQQHLSGSTNSMSHNHHHHHQHHYHHRRSHRSRNLHNNPAAMVLRPILNIVDNNDNGDQLAQSLTAMNSVDHNNNTAQSLYNQASINDNHNSDLLNRVAILKEFGPTDISTDVSVCNGVQRPAPSSRRSCKYEKPTSVREARRMRQRQRSNPSTVYDPAVEQEFVRLRDSVPSIAGHQVSDLTIINEAISLICDLESQLIHKLRCKLPDLREKFLK